MSEIINVFAKYSNGMARAYVENGIDVMETYFWETGSNARVYITCIYDFIKIQPAIQLPRGKDDGQLINFDITGGAIGPEGVVNYDTYFTFMARFSGKAVVVMVPYSAVTCIWSPDTNDLILYPPQPADVSPGSPLDNILKHAAKDYVANLAGTETTVAVEEHKLTRAKPHLSLVIDNTEKKNEKLH